MKEKLQAMGYWTLAQWHRANIVLYRWRGNNRLIKGMPARGSNEEASLLALCRGANRHVCRAMHCACRQRELLQG